MQSNEFGMTSKFFVMQSNELAKFGGFAAFLVELRLGSARGAQGDGILADAGVRGAVESMAGVGACRDV